MAIKGFRDINGACVPIEEIDFVRDAARFNCSPATLAMLLDNVTARDGIGYSASMLGATPRQYLLRSRDFYPPTGQAMSAHMGTIKHQQVNVQRDRLIVEQRFHSKRDPRLSGQIDHAAIIELTDDGTLVVDLYDLKNTKWYSATLIAKDVWKNHPEYAWQLNLCAAMMEENGAECPACGGEGRRWFDTYHADDNRVTENVEPCVDCHATGHVGVKVRNLYLECIPADASYKHAVEAAKLRLPEYQKVIVKIDRKSADETYAVYDEAIRLRDEAIARGYAPLCEDRWSNYNISDLRCQHYCDVKAECITYQHSIGEPHPIAPLAVALEASIGQAEAQS